jgi:hypothetical protein
LIHVDASLSLIPTLARARHTAERMAAASSRLKTPRTRIQP